MNKEQAKEVLEKEKAYMLSHGGDRQAEALDMGIKALEQEPCEDAVSRADLSKIYENRFIELQKAHQTDKQLGVNWCINTLKELPSVTPTTCIAKISFDKEAFQKIVDEKVKELVTHGTCKDCKHNKNGICPNYRHFVDDDFYCADFEKRGNGDD